jgi:hypothetical protein
MLYDLVRIHRGEEKVFMTDTRPKVLARKKQLMASQRKGLAGGRVEYVIRPTESNVKFKAGPNTMDLSGGSGKVPRVGR